MGNLCSDGPSRAEDPRPYQPRLNEQRTPFNGRSRDPRLLDFPSLAPVSREVSPQVHRNSQFGAGNPYAPTIYNTVREVDPPDRRNSRVETTRPYPPCIVPVVITPPVHSEVPKLFIIGDSMTVQNEVGTVQVRTIDNSTAKWIKRHPLRTVVNEIEILRSLNHPNIIRVLFTLSANDAQHVAYESVKIILSACVHDLHNYRDICCQLTDAIEYLQGRRIVHLALKPDNIFVVEDNRRQIVKIGGFSCAVRLERNSASVPRDFSKDLTYSAPEVNSGSAVYLSSDVYSLGCVIFNIFSKGFCVRGHPSVVNIVSWRKDDITSSDILCADLIHNLVFQKETSRLKGDQIKNHPFFWDTDKTINFIIEVNKLIEAGDSDFRKCMFYNSRSALGGNDDWSKLIEDEVMKELNGARKDFIKRKGMQDNSAGKKNIINLIQAMRHVAVHSQPSSLIQGLMGSNENFLGYWLEKFPLLIQHMYNAKINFELGNFKTDEQQWRVKKDNAKTYSRS